jgi:hypothetical protein
MPKYTFICSGCKAEAHTIMSRHVKEIECPACKEKMKRQLPKISGSPVVNEVIDDYAGIVQPADQREVVEQRRDEYYWTVEVPRFVNSGKYGVDTMVELGWVTVDDKGNLQVQNRPPHKR